MNPNLSSAAEQGSIDALYSLIRSDPGVLDQVDALPFASTPLHIAASSGQINFVMEIMTLKPLFARKLNEDGYTPIHLALQNRKTQVVHKLVDIDENLVRVPGREGLTSLHYVAQIGDLPLLAKFLRACPNSIEDVTSRGESVLHIAARSENKNTLKLLLGWLQRTWLKDAYLWQKKLLNSKDEEGNTLLHIAVSKNLPDIVQLLLGFRWYFRCQIDLDDKNSGDYTVFDILEKQVPDKHNQEIRVMLRRAKFFSTLLQPRIQSLENYFQSPVPIDEKFYIFLVRQRTNISNESRNALLVVAVLLAAVNFQATVSPPGGVWQDSKDPQSVGTSTMPRETFLVMAGLNVVSFVATVFAIFVLLPGDFKSGLINLPLHLLSLYFIAAVLVTAPNDLSPYCTCLYYLIFCIFAPLLILLLQFLVNYRRRQLVKVFHPDMKMLDPTLP